MPQCACAADARMYRPSAVIWIASYPKVARSVDTQLTSPLTVQYQLSSVIAIGFRGLLLFLSYILTWQE